MTKILIVDDEPLMLLSLKTMLAWEDYDIDIQAEAKNGKEAYLYLLEHPEIDIVITDVDMPLMNGLELCEAITSKNATHDFIFLSLFGNYEYVRRAFKSGANDYILKSDLEAKKLLSVLNKMIKSRQERFGIASERQESTQMQSPQKSFLHKCITEAVSDSEKSTFQNLFPEWSFPFCMMFVRPFDIQSIESRYDSSTVHFQNTVVQTLSQNMRFEKKAIFDISLDTYIVFAETQKKLEDGFSSFYEMAWMYFDTSFDKIISDPLTSLEDFFSALSTTTQSFSSYSKNVVKARRYIQEHYQDEELQLHDIASYVEVSKNYLSSEFTKETGETIVEYISQVRVLHAKKLLRETNLKVYEIADRTGFANTETFNRTFKKITGKTPSNFV